ncbi:AAA family ATPase [Fructilactobacillus cliffordii]|uniref:ATP-dependent nuclease n=1 Tax=Fructilactobacillus cliffordii TaxID=2940299 RepID=UPI0020935BBF|nr:AAA family ATPase [Fructilactobacillus cliffordii]USS86317.1 AAA family ATPase [Fructilactobacillus cliffordii]
MGYLEKIKIHNYKTFKDFEMDFNKDLNIIVGENGVGKTSILESIGIVLNQYIFFNNPNFVNHLFNKSSIDEFKNNDIKDIKELPYIKIEAYFNFDNEQDINLSKFNGTNYSELHSYNNEPKYGITFEFKFDESFEDVISIDELNSSYIIPTDYYKSTWTTFAGCSYKRFQNPLKSIIIDNSINKNDVYGSYSRNLFNSKIDSIERTKIEYKFSNQMKKLINEISYEHKESLFLDDDKKFSVNEEKSKLDKLLDIEENDISISDMGSGEEELLKTELSLNNKNDSKLILIEEPENHLSFSNTKKQISLIIKRKNDCQIILTTHESMILNKLNLSKAIWINNSKSKSLKNLHEDTQSFFEKAGNFDILTFILANKVMLVEGPSEFILFPIFFQKMYEEKTLDSEKIEILTMNGIKYKRFVEIANDLKKYTAAFIDNDGNQNRINYFDSFNDSENYINVFTEADKSNLTFENALYNESNANKDLIKSILNLSDENPEEIISKMKNDKTGFAIKLFDHMKDNMDTNIDIPNYIKRGFEYLEKGK